MPATHVGETSGRTRNNRLRHLSPEGNHLYINAGRENLNQYIFRFPPSQPSDIRQIFPKLFFVVF